MKLSQELAWTLSYQQGAGAVNIANMGVVDQERLSLPERVMNFPNLVTILCN